MYLNIVNQCVSMLCIYNDALSKIRVKMHPYV